MPAPDPGPSKVDQLAELIRERPEVGLGVAFLGGPSLHRSSSALPADNNQTDNFAQAITEVSENLTQLVQDEIELAKAEMIEKATSLARGAAAVAAGAVFGVFAVIFVLLTIAWAVNAVFVSDVPTSGSASWS